MSSTAYSPNAKVSPTPWVVVVVLEPEGLNVFAGGVKHQINGYNHHHSLIEGGRDPNNPNETVDEAAQRLLASTASIGPVEFLVATKRPLSMNPDNSTTPNAGAIVVGPDKAAHVLYYIARKPHPRVDPKEGDPVTGLQFNQADWIPPQELCRRLDEGASRERKAFYRELSAATGIVVDTARQWCRWQAEEQIVQEKSAAGELPLISLEYEAAKRATLEGDYAEAAVHYQAKNKLVDAAIEGKRPAIRRDITQLAPDKLPAFLSLMLAESAGNFTTERNRRFSSECTPRELYGARALSAASMDAGDDALDKGVYDPYYDGGSVSASPKERTVATAAIAEEPLAARPHRSFMHKVTYGLKSILNLSS